MQAEAIISNAERPSGTIAQFTVAVDDIAQRGRPSRKKARLFAYREAKA